MRRRLGLMGAALLLAVTWLVAQSATYPAGVVSFTTKTAGQQIQSAHINALQAEVTAVENGLLNGLAHLIRPLTDATFDLGTSAFRWRNLYLSGTTTINTVAYTWPGSQGTAGTVPRNDGAGTLSWSIGWTVVTTTSTGTVNDFAPGLVGHTIVRCNNASLLTIDGVAAGTDGQWLVFVSIGAGEVDLAHQNAGSLAASRFINFATSGLTALAPGSGMAAYQYDATTARWRLMQHEQGGWITRTFAAGNYTASAGTWTVASATVDAYYLRGRTMTYGFNVGGTTSTTPASVRITIPASMTSTSNAINTYLVNNTGGGASEVGFTTTSSTNVVMQRIPSSNNFAAGTVSVLGQITFEVQ